MIVNVKSGMYFSGGKWLTLGEAEATGLPAPRQARLGTMTSAVLKAHNRSESDENIKIVFDALASHDITFVGIIQTARASGLKQFPVPYVPPPSAPTDRRLEVLCGDAGTLVGG